MTSDNVEVAAAEPVRSRARKPLLAVGAIGAVVFVAFAGMAVASALARDHADVDRALAAPAHGVLIETDGSVTVGAGSPGALALHSHLEWSWRRPTVVTSTLPGGVTLVQVRCHDIPVASYGCGVSTRVTVPAATAVRVVGSDGSVTASGFTGTVDLTTSDGALHVDHLSGPVRLHTSDGAVHADDLTSSRVDARTSDGSVHLTFDTSPTQVLARSSDGSITVTVPRTQELYRLSTSTSDGHVRTSVRSDPTAERTIDVHTSDGSITVAYP